MLVTKSWGEINVGVGVWASPKYINSLDNLFEHELIAAALLSAYWLTYFDLSIFVIPTSVILSLAFNTILSTLVNRFWFILCKYESIWGKS